jgi:hypothetical protein
VTSCSATPAVRGRYTGKVDYRCCLFIAWGAFDSLPESIWANNNSAPDNSCTLALCGFAQENESMKTHAHMLGACVQLAPGAVALLQPRGRRWIFLADEGQQAGFDEEQAFPVPIGSISTVAGDQNVHWESNTSPPRGMPRPSLLLCPRLLACRYRPLHDPLFHVCSSLIRRVSSDRGAAQWNQRRFLWRASCRQLSLWMRFAQGKKSLCLPSL